MKIEILPATRDQQPILANLLELYAYDFTEFFDFDIGNDGFYGYKWLPLYWGNANRFPFIVYVDDKIAGFVFVQKGSPISDEKEVYDIAEFFIMQKYKRKNVGSTVAMMVWRMFKGAWQVRVLVENTTASIFWLKTITKFVNQQPTAVKQTMKGDDWLVYRFNSS